MTVIKRYSNRKLYDSDAARYVTLEELGDRIGRGEDISVVDYGSGADLTALTMMQVIFEREKKIGGMLPKAILTSAIQTGNIAINNLRDGLISFRDSNQAIEQEIRRRLKVLFDDGQLAVEEFQHLTDMLINPRWRQREAAPEGDKMDMRDPNAADPEEVNALSKQVDDLEREIETLKANKTE